ncbi:uncharacterized protein [Bemisia tabaci]|uniref:uncharacterized protein n=1 Tax=Bemisia tabaci TaxID=7038 RepID=UPI003B283C90
MSDCKPVSTPMEPGQMIERTGNSADDFPYRQAVGSLLYLSNKTRPDISFAVSYASRHMEKPEKNDIDIIKRILRYLRGTTGDGVMFERSTESELTLSAFCDASYADDLITRRSTSGYMVLLNDNPVSWASRRQPIVATSTTEMALFRENNQNYSIMDQSSGNTTYPLEALPTYTLWNSPTIVW